MEKLAFALVTAARKLKTYFQAYTMIVLIDKPLRRAMSSLGATGQMTLWAIELNEFNVLYRLCMAMKGQVVADFIAKFTNMEGQGGRRMFKMEYPHGRIVQQTDRRSWCGNP